VEATGTPKGHGVVIDVSVTPEAFETRPKSLNLSNPTSSVRSYLEWVSYAYRIGDSAVADSAMSPNEEVRVNSYVQMNLQENNRLIDQNLDSITFGKVRSVNASQAIVPATEKWTYRWVSAQEAGKQLDGPFTIRYATKYSVVKNEKGDWLVDNVEAKELGEGK